MIDLESRILRIVNLEREIIKCIGFELKDKIFDDGRFRFEIVGILSLVLKFELNTGLSN